KETIAVRTPAHPAGEIADIAIERYVSDIEIQIVIVFPTVVGSKRRYNCCAVQLVVRGANVGVGIDQRRSVLPWEKVNLLRESAPGAVIYHVAGGEHRAGPEHCAAAAGF